jgi:hypothetical protein
MPGFLNAGTLASGAFRAAGGDSNIRMVLGVSCNSAGFPWLKP